MNGTPAFRLYGCMFGGMFQRKSFLPVVAVSLFAVLLLDVGFTSAATSGGKCSKVGLTQKTKGVTFTCSKVGKTLKWVRKSVKPSSPIVPTTISGAQLLQANPSSPEPLSHCRLKDARLFKAAGEWQAITYPATPANGFTNSGVIDIAVVFECCVLMQFDFIVFFCFCSHLVTFVSGENLAISRFKYQRALSKSS